jgi:hypothetical protein
MGVNLLMTMPLFPIFLSAVALTLALVAKERKSLAVRAAEAPAPQDTPRGRRRFVRSR